MDLVLKIGGADGMDYEAIADDIKWFCNGGGKMVLVHGGSAATNQVAAALGHPARFVTTASGHTSRRTDRRTMEIFQMVYCGQMNKGWVERLQKRGLPALGLSGMDGRLWEGRRKRTLKVVENGRRRVLRDDYTGRVERVNRDLLQTILKIGYLPVLTPPAISYEGEAINVDGDRAAASTAVALAARQLVILTNVPGLLRQYPDANSLVPFISAAHLADYLKGAGGRMKKKLLGAGEALAGGVERVVLADGRVPNPLRRAIEGQGTVIS
ncbi:MAG: [LysW]-aminoadipate kinase [Candidatus Marinimicrobia bacterium]|nr:[LysW]-aminoadipate kinase [Candidatus Neomarinimicrobiota bacterium]